MDKIEKIRQEIERRIKLYDGNNTQEMWIGNTYRAVLSFLDTLSEEPDKSLEEAAAKYAEPYISTVADNVKWAFKAGAEWQASQMPMPEDTVLFNKGVAEGRRLEREDMLKDAVEADVNTYKDLVLNCGWVEFVVDMPSSETDKFGDKVRIIVIKAEEESK